MIDDATPPSIYDYRQREKISLDDRCTVCDGLGKYVAARGPHSKLYRTCALCVGTGRQLRKRVLTKH